MVQFLSAESESTPPGFFDVEVCGLGEQTRVVILL